MPDDCGLVWNPEHPDYDDVQERQGSGCHGGRDAKGANRNEVEAADVRQRLDLSVKREKER
jgi:hypothetical protein